MREGNYVLDGKEITDLYKLMLFSNARYIEVEATSTRHHIEMLMPSVSDRGRYKWIAEGENVDCADCFPRLYFLQDSFSEEFNAWLAVRNQKIVAINVPLEYSPDFNAEFFESYLKLKMTMAMTKNNPMKDG